MRRERRQICDGSHKSPRDRALIRWPGGRIEWLGYCAVCDHLYSINSDGRIHKHEFHGCAGGWHIIGCPRNQNAEYAIQEVLRWTERVIEVA